MRYLTAIEAAHRIGVSEKTVRLWVKEGKLEALHPAKNRLAIAEDDVERLAQERRLYYRTQPETPSSDHTQPDISALERRIRELEQKVLGLEQERHTLIHPYIPAQVPPPKPRQEPRATLTKNDLPQGCIIASKFAEAHSVPRETLRDHMLIGLGKGTVPGEQTHPTLPVKDHVDYSERPKPGRPKEKERFLDQEQQRKTFAFWTRHNVSFSQCEIPECWCHTP